MLGELFSLDGRVALVTGASGGLGSRFARVLHQAGASVVVSARRAARLSALADELGDRLVPAPCDISVDADCERLVAGVLERFGRLDILINNAATGGAMPSETEPMEHFRRVIDVNLHAAFLLSRLAGSQMLSQGKGSIVNIASIIGLVGSGQIGQASYCASKGAVISLTRELGTQWAQRGVRVNALAPGWFHTEMTDAMFADEKAMSWLRRNCPLGRPGEDHELDGALLFLASDASSYCTGQVIAVDGGWTAR